MKKSLLALAVLGAFAGAASAQSTVTLYGRLDLTVGKDVGTDLKSMQNGSGNRLGVRGVEDLGGGLQALFNIEHRFNGDTGVQAQGPIAAGRDPNLVNAAPLGRFWAARSIVGFQGGFGRVVLGREYTTAFLQSQLVADPWGWDTVVTRGGMEAITGGGGATTRRTDATTRLSTVRNDSSLTYNFTGMGLNVGVQIAEGTDTITNTPNRPVNFAVSYGAGPIVIGLGHERNGDEVIEKSKWTTVNASFDIGFVKLGGLVGRGNNFANADKKSWLVTAVAPIGSGEFRAGVGQLKEDTVLGRDVKTVQMVALGYHYSLSKRTTVYADFINNSKANLPVVGGVEKRGYDVGVKHNF